MALDGVDNDVRGLALRCIVSNSCGSITSDTAALDVFCDCPEQFTFAAGVDDNFTLPAEAAAPSADLLAALSRPSIGFDELPGITPGVPNERYVSHTFTGLPSGISAATLTFRVRAGAGGEGNHTDRVRLGFADPTGLNDRWGRRFGYFGGDDGIVFAAPRQWEQGDVALVTLDLGALPRAEGTTQSILPELSSRGFLDLLVTDDSGVDFATLTVTVGSGDGRVVAWLGSQPTDMTTCGGGGGGAGAEFRVTTGGIGGPFTYRWRRNGVDLADGGHISGSTTATLSINPAVAADVGNYDCVVTGANWCLPGVLVSDSATLTVCPTDLNCDQQITPADIAAFVNAWFVSLNGGTLAGDFDGNGVVNPADVGAFVNAWFAALTNGC